MLNSDGLNSNFLNAPASFSAIGEGLLISLEQQLVRVPPIHRFGGQLNKTRVNSAPVDSPMTLIGVGRIINFYQSVGRVAVGELLSAKQRVGLAGLGIQIGIEQGVRLGERGEGSLITIEQFGTVVASDSIVAVEHTITNRRIPSHYSRTGWDATIVVGGRTISKDELYGIITIDRQEGQAALAQFTIIPSSGFQEMDYYAGKAVTIDIRTSGGVRRIYTGIVDIPEANLVLKTITLKCTDRRKELINAQLKTVVGTIGHFSSLIFQDVKDTADQLEKRLSTTPYSVDFDVFGTYSLTPWATKVSPDFTFFEDDIYYSEPKVEFSSRGRVTNRVKVNFQYRYERLHHMERNFTWRSPIADAIRDLLEFGYSLTFRATVASSIKAAGWPIKVPIDYIPIWPSGWYFGRSWSTTSFNSGYFPKVDSHGNVILDASGNPVLEFVQNGGTDFGPLYCMGASWIGTTRWAQTVTEQYTMVVKAPQSILQYGIVEQEEQYSATADFDTSLWENYNRYSDLGLGNSYYIDQSTNRSAFNTAVRTALYKAKNTILASHRDTKVSCSMFILPRIDLKHTVRINTDIVDAKGKVSAILHELNIGTGEAKTTFSISLFRAQGTQAESELSIPDLTTEDIAYPTDTIVFGNHFGEDPNTLPAQSWTGFIGNRFPYGGLARTNYTEQFIVVTPPISDDLRQEKSRNASQEYDVSIPNDLLTIVY